MTLFKRFYELLSSMRFAVSVLTVLGIASIIGTVLKQNQPYDDYIIEFGQFWFDFFEKLGLFDVYHSAWFLIILIFLVVSTSLCIYRNTPLMLKEIKSFRENATQKSLRAFSHQASYALSGSLDTAQQRLIEFLTRRGFRYKIAQMAPGQILIAAKAGSAHRLGYIFTHLAIVVIAIGGLMDGNVPLKLQELFGFKKVEVRDISADQVPPISHLSVRNLSFRANMTLAEGTSSHVAFERVRDGYMVQDLPFSVGLTQFRIEHYPTGQPKSFESDLVIYDPELKTPLKKTITVNHPLTYKGITIYQSDFQDGGSTLRFNAWNILDSSKTPTEVSGEIFKKTPWIQGNSQHQIEFTDFKKFNVLNLSPDGRGKPHNVGPSVTFKIRDEAGQANEYVNYMQPLQIGDKVYFVSGMRASPQEDFKYLKIPADAHLELAGFMALKSVMFDRSLHPLIAHRYVQAMIGNDQSKAAVLTPKFEKSVTQLLDVFSEGGYVAIARMIENSVPAAERERAAQTYIKIMTGAASEAYQFSQERLGHPIVKIDEQLGLFLQDAMNTMSDLFYYGAPVYLELKDFHERQASGLQLTRSPGKVLVYSGSLLLVLGIFAMFYIRERRIWFWLDEKRQEVLFAMSTNRKNRDFELEFDRYQKQVAETLSKH
jgi:cytochrome c biogenesis protein